MEDSFLIQQVLAGEQAAFKFLVLRYQRPLFRFLRGFGLEEHVIEELAQESFVRAYESLARYSPEKGASFGTWVFQIGKNLALNELARSHRALDACLDGEVPHQFADAVMRRIATNALVLAPFSFEKWIVDTLQASRLRLQAAYLCGAAIVLFAVLLPSAA
jgi:RNA polymerase sigma factor (sigma-70 family)